jgi:hypothetical protein
MHRAGAAVELRAVAGGESGAPGSQASRGSVRPARGASSCAIGAGGSVPAGLGARRAASRRRHRSAIQSVTGASSRVRSA